MSASGPSVPELRTERLVLRPFAPADAAAVQRLAGDRAVAATTARIPHPYPGGAAEAWIATHERQFATREGVTFAIARASDGVLMGSVGLVLGPAGDAAELGYWVGVPFWGQGYGTEAVRAVLRYGFEGLGLHRIFAHHMRGNEASGRVMEKAGMRYEGCLRHGMMKWGEYRDMLVYGILADDPRP